MRHQLALGLLSLACFIGAGACCFLVVAIKRELTIRYWERRLDKGVKRELSKLPIRLVK